MKERIHVKYRLKKVGHEDQKGEKGSRNVPAVPGGSNAGSIVAARLLLLDGQIFQSDVSQIVFDNFLQSLPERQGRARCRAGTRIALRGYTGDGQHGAFRQFENIFRSVFTGMPGQAVAAGFSPGALHKTRFQQNGDDLFQITDRDILPDGDFLEGYVLLVLMLRKINHHAQCITPSGGNLHHVGLNKRHFGTAVNRE